MSRSEYRVENYVLAENRWYAGRQERFVSLEDAQAFLDEIIGGNTKPPIRYRIVWREISPWRPV